MELKVNLPVMEATRQNLLQQQREMEQLASQVVSIRAGLSYKVLQRDNIDARLQNAAKELKERASGLGNLAAGLQQAIDTYQACEDTLIGTDFSEWSNVAAAAVGAAAAVKKAVEELLAALKGKDNSCNDFGGDPVNLGTGNFIYEKEYLKQSGLVPMSFCLFYNTLLRQADTLGEGWIHNYQVRLCKEGKKVSLHLADGRTIVYRQNKKGYYFCTGDRNSLLVEREEGFFYRTAQGVSYQFDVEGNNTFQEDRNGNCIMMTYDAERRLQMVASCSDEVLLYTYDASGLLTQVADGCGRKVVLSYSGRLLEQVVDEAGQVYRFSYDELHRLSRVVDSRGIALLENVFDGQDRVVRQRFADGGEIIYSYDDSSGMLTVTEQNGNQTVYVHDDQFRLVERKTSDGTERFAYNDNNQRTLVVDKLGNRTTYAYDTRGNLTRAVNPLGERLDMEYNAQNKVTRVSLCGAELTRRQYDFHGNLTRVKDAVGRTSRVEYLDNGKPSVVNLPDGSRVLLDYDDHGNIVRVLEEGAQAETRYTYDELGRVTQTVDGNGNRTAYAYDCTGNLTAVTNADGKTRTYVYNELGKVTQITDFDGSTVVTAYNEMGKPYQQIDQDGGVTTLEYDKMWNVVRREDAGGAEVRYTYDPWNRLTSVTAPNGGVTRYAYDPNGNRTKIVAPDGSEATMVYNAVNRMVQVTDPDGAVNHLEYDRFGHLAEVVDPCGNVKRFVHDRAGQLTAFVDVLGNETRYSYNALGRVSTVTDPAGRTTSYEYNPGGLLKKVIYPDKTCEQYTYDANKNLLTRERNGFVLRYHYDCMNRLVKLESNQGQEKRYTYDAVGNIRSVTDANGNTTSYTYSPKGNLCTVMDALGNRSEYTYDPVGNLTEIRQYDNLDSAEMDTELSNAQALHLTLYTRNALGQVESVTDPLGNQVRYTYDLLGRVQSKTDEDGFLTEYQYTPSGQLDGIVYADGTSVKLSYNPLKQLTEIQDWLGKTTVELDAKGQVQQVTDPQARTVQYQHNELGQRTAMIYPDGRQVEYVYDELRRLQKIQMDAQQVEYRYDAAGRLSGKQFSNGFHSSYEYSATGKLQRLCSFQADEMLDCDAYTYDLVGNKIGVERRRRGLEAENGSYHYAYDALNRLSDVMKDGVLLRQYEYDGFGNRIFSQDTEGMTEYSYNAANQLLHRERDGAFTEYRYDRRGNLTQVWEDDVQKHCYEYGPMNQLGRASDSMGRVSDYAYNGLGQRVGVRQFEGALTADAQNRLDAGNPIRSISYVLDQATRYQNLLQTEEDSGIVRDFLWDGGVVAEQGTNGDRFFLRDDLGSPLRYLDDMGQVLESYGYGEFGEALYDDLDGLQPFGFTGYRRETHEGTLHAGAREYDPENGRFAAVDPKKGYTEAPYSQNSYVYCFNMPLLLVDRNGAWPSWEDIKDGISGACDTVMEGANDLWENYVPDDVKKTVSDTAQTVLRAGREVTEAPVFFGYSISDGLNALSRTEIGEEFLSVVSFDRTEDGVYHARQDCWQEPFGYNDAIDFVFNGVSSMDTEKYPFTTKDGTEYTIWMWKGDYYNLGAGAETGIYTGEGYHKTSASDTNLTMTLAVYDKDGNKIFTYNPKDPQWWITGFNPDPAYQDMKAEDLEVRGTIDFSKEPELWEAFYGQYKGRKGWCFDAENKTASYKW